MHVRAGLEGELLIQGHGRIHIGIAMHTAETHEFRVLKARHLAEADCLRGIGQLGLAAHQIEHRLVPILGAKLKQRERTPPGARICEAHRLERTEGQRLLAAREKFLAQPTPSMIDMANKYFEIFQKLNQLVLEK